ncbi:MAG: TSUP family transporter [Alphaproteobacteria bacterium]|nr:TSUP family transporter [Alphaproteobacteria bacterium]
MSIYLPIAEMPVSGLLVLLLSALVGFVSGLTGLGGGFIMTPMLIFMGIPAPVAVATQASQITATSVSGLLAQARRRMVDWRMGLLLSTGGVLGSTFGVSIFSTLLAAGQIDILITLLYVLFLTVIGALMLFESFMAMRAAGKPIARPAPRPSYTAFNKLPFLMRFPRSGLYISVLPPLALGFGVGVLAAIMGVGGAFILAPAMIYLLRMPTNVVIGTSLLQVLIVAAVVTLLQATITQKVDMLLAAILIVGGVIGAQLGARLGARLPGEQLRAALAIVVFGAAAKLLWDLLTPPAYLYVLDPS